MNTQNITHEQFVHAVSDIACGRLSSTDACTCKKVKLVYGAGPDGVRGITYYERWKDEDNQSHPFVAINALHQESFVQLAGTTIHELGHVLAGWDAGHGPAWKAACEKLGLRRIKAAGTEYKLAMFDKDIRGYIANLKTSDGKPIALSGSTPNFKIGRGKSGPKPCNAAIGTRGGTSRGVGSGSRLRLYQCSCPKPFKIRAASDVLNCTCNVCNNLFTKAL